MATSATQVALQYWLAAIEQPIGLGLNVSDPAAAKRQLYAARSAADPTLRESLDQFTIRTSPRNPAGELFLVRTGPPAAANPQAALAAA